MTYLAETFEETASGTTISAANSGLDSVTIAGTDTETFDNSHAAHGSQSLKIVKTATNGTGATFAAWGASMGTQTQVWFRLCGIFTSAPAANLWLLWAGQSATGCGRVGLTSGALLTCQDSANSNTNTGTVAANTNGTPFRLEATIIGSATAGQIQAKLWNSVDSTGTPTDTITTVTTYNTLGSMDHYRFGGTVSTSVGTNFTFWIDDIALSNVGYIGAAGYKTDTETGAGADGGPIGGRAVIGVDDAVGFP